MGEGESIVIYVLLNGRIGNQLFMYSLAEEIREVYLKQSTIVIDDYWVVEKQWENSLLKYPLENTIFVHNRRNLISLRFLFPVIALYIYKVLVRNKNFNEKHKIELKYQKIFNFFGLVVCENGYLPYKIYRKNVIVFGYFQTENYFKNVQDNIKKIFSIKNEIDRISYNGLSQIKERNSICVSIKVEHNVGSEIYDVCSYEYWEKAISYMVEHVEKPLFFICSDNVEYVKNNLIDCSKYDVIFQDKNHEPHISLAVMAQCKHFIIGNTTFGWWAQFLSDYPDKIVIAPSKWMNCDMPIDLYQDNWILF